MLKLKPHEHDVLARAPAQPQATRRSSPWWVALAGLLSALIGG